MLAEDKTRLYEFRRALPPVMAEDVEIAYRTLRKSFEDRGNKPGADDFYYGEMLLRRWAPRGHAKLARFTHRAVLWLHWLVAGHGLRAWRAATCFGLTVFFGALLLRATTTANQKPPDFGGALLYAFQFCAMPLVRSDPPLQYSGWGQIVRLGLVILGPVFAAAMIFALHARIRR
ncbi:hypothetical protein AB5J62_22050 [Amycolatopsis sp. cg5]|uniref:hypothetical protein n=1 Tax=Amycolatopsis sp. cg5 TaxID=3238802 RepID=UPI0035257DC3